MLEGVKKMRLEGSCHCRAVQFSVEAHSPVPFMHCHCSICRKTAGSGGYAINLGAAAASLNRLALALSPIALALLLLYSYTKRFTALSHLVLGLCLALAPVGAWIAVRGSVTTLPILLGLAVLFWTAGFDVIYALQDEEFDRATGLKSIPARLGAKRALVVSGVFHLVMAVLLVAVWRLAGGGWILLAGIAATLAALVYQHAIVKPGDLSRIDAAFFTANGFVSVTLAVCGIADVLNR